MKIHHHRAILLTTNADQLRTNEVLGTGGWLPYDEREVLDWMTLIASLGWECVLLDPDELITDSDRLASVNWVIVSKDIADLNENKRSRLQEKLALFPVVVISHTVGTISATTSVMGSRLKYLHEAGARKWTCQNEVTCYPIHPETNAAPLLWIDDLVIGTRSHVGNAKFILLGFHSSEARDAEGLFSALLKEVLIGESLQPVAWFEWANTLLLRMDDPGSPQRVNDHKLNARTLTDAEWAGIGNILHERGARLSIGYVPAWVDDGDASYGELSVEGEQVERVPGKVYPSPFVRYKQNSPKDSFYIYDLQQEFHGIRKLIDEGSVSAELHGYTHMFPDIQAWLEADDRHTNVSWFREFGRSATRFTAQLPQSDQPLEKGIKLFRKLFRRTPSTIIFPGEEFTVHAVKDAWKKGIRMVGSYYLAMPIGNQLCWNHYICAPYLDRAQASFFDHSLPVVGYFHDFDITQNGLPWFSQHLDKWRALGARHYIDYAGFASVISTRLSLCEAAEGYTLIREGVLTERDTASIRVGIYIPGIHKRWEVPMPAGQSVLKLETAHPEIIHSKTSERWHASL